MGSPSPCPNHSGGDTAPTSPPWSSHAPAGLGNHHPQLCCCPKTSAQLGTPRLLGGGHQNTARGGGCSPRLIGSRMGEQSQLRGGSGSPEPSRWQPFEAGLWAAFAHSPRPPGHPLGPRTPRHPLPPQHGGRDSLGAVQTPLGTGPTPVSKSTCRHRLPPPDFPLAPRWGAAETPPPSPQTPTFACSQPPPPCPLATPSLCGTGTDPQETPGGG